MEITEREKQLLETIENLNKTIRALTDALIAAQRGLPTMPVQPYFPQPAYIPVWGPHGPSYITD